MVSVLYAAKGFVLAAHDSRYSEEERLMRNAEFHNMGDIRLAVDGEEIPLNGVPISFWADEEEREQTAFCNGAFWFRRGNMAETNSAFLSRQLCGEEKPAWTIFPLNLYFGTTIGGK